MKQVMQVFADTGEVIERDRTPSEQAQYEADQKVAAKLAVLALSQLSLTQAATSAGIAHAKSLGFTDEMIAVMYPNLQSESAITP